MDSQFQWLTALHILTFQRIPHLITGQFVSSLPYTTVTGVIGEEIVLPCRVVAEHVPEIFSVQWIFHEQSEKITVSRYDGKSKKEIQDERYQGRTYFFHSEFRAGNMSLHLKDIKNSDKGSYTCLVSFDNHQHDELIELEVAARGIVPSIFLKNYMKESISLSCHTEGWFPEPRVIWLDSQEQIRREPSTTKIMMMPAGLYSVVTSMNLEPGSDMEVSCRIVNRLLNTTSESRVLISDVFFPSISKWLVFFLVMLCLSLVLIFSTFCKLKIKMKTAMEEEKGQLKSVLDFWEAQSHAVPITVDAAGGDLELQVPPAPGTRSSDPSGAADARAPSAVPIALARDGFAAGKRYWEVEVARRPDWVLGVVRGGRERGAVLPAGDSWALHSSRGALFCGRGDAAVEPPPPSCSVVGVLLDLEERRVKFYEAVHMVLLATIPVGEGDAHTFYPFVPKSEGSLAPLVFRPVRIPSALENL
ncbi:butyrophilin-like protein 9 [Nothoprocta perdicaria]|uniref:butyrophilin-like protein 9 n=1 Tax=Nothoprocta perdicaria TaxID=30464 RepID=UPI000E1BE4A5|nr:butyrophilin-like protein 9 [Nothoprocta perdicaria]